ncbi:MAG: hypothetical protein IH948_06465, partial [Bacteroidetes bacterium]|nr:hypothetical protein [Bacteroidota bacterium]
SNNILELADWLNENTERNEVLLTLDPELILHLPAYTYLKLYNPARARSQVGKAERETLLFNSLKFFNVSTNAFMSMLSKMDSHRNINDSPSYSQTQLRLFELVFFYSIHNKLSDEQIDDLSTAYKNYLSSGSGNNAKSQSDYLIITPYNRIIDSDFCEQCITEGMSKEVELSNNILVYKIN